jgi:hypothetical protein
MDEVLKYLLDVALEKIKYEKRWESPLQMTSYNRNTNINHNIISQQKYPPEVISIPINFEVIFFCIKTFKEEGFVLFLFFFFLLLMINRICRCCTGNYLGGTIQKTQKENKPRHMHEHKAEYGLWVYQKQN